MAKLKSTARRKPAARPATQAGAGIEGVSRTIMDSAQQIWLAGMGAFSRAQAEGTRLFETLVKEGMSLEHKTRKLATGQVDAVRGAVESRVGQVRERASDTWDRLEQVFEDRVQRALTRLGVPGRDEIRSLSERVDALTREVRRVQGTPARKAARKPKPSAATRSSARKKTVGRAPARKGAAASARRKAPKAPSAG
ncbi:MAG TPA: phasin family protein [Xanthomonadaceae bacterium]|nr:phasin family protein [Xanthomonadaceae bacterium]